MARSFKTTPFDFMCERLCVIQFASWFTLLLVLMLAPASHAQEGNVLGLPAVPQNRPAPLAAASAAPAAKKPSAAPKPTDAEIKAVLSGNLQLASFYENGLITLRVTTSRTYVGNQVRAQALQAARLVQRDTRLACGKLCKPADMPVPKLQADNTLVFDVVIQDYDGVMSTTNMVNLVSGKPVSIATKTATAPPQSAEATTAPANSASAAGGR